MNDTRRVTLTLHMPADELIALARLVKRIDYETVNRFASPCATYGAGRTETDTMWCAVTMLRAGLADAGFKPR